MKSRTSIQRSAAAVDDDGVADAGDVLLERLVPRVAVDAFEFDCFDKLLDVLVQRIRTLRLVVKAFLRELISDVVLDALAELLRRRPRDVRVRLCPVAPSVERVNRQS